MSRPRPVDGMVLIVGGRGSCKTALLQEIDKAHRALGGGHVTVWDHMGHWLAGVPDREVVRSAEAEEAAARAIEVVRELGRPTVLLLDEIALAFPLRSPPRPPSALFEISRMGRQARATGPWRRPAPVGLVGATQRPADVDTGLRGLVDVLLVGAVGRGDHSTLGWLEKTAGPESVAAAINTEPGAFRPYRLR